MAGSGGASPLGFLIPQKFRRGLRGERQTFSLHSNELLDSDKMSRQPVS